MNARLQQELAVARPIGPGKGPGQKRVQEYLGINGIKLKIDGDWGPATDAGLQRFAPGKASVDQDLMNRLAGPLIRMTTFNSLRAGTSIGAAIVAIAQVHLAAHPIEIGGQNAGPYVRHYMDGNEGPGAPWCAGFVTDVIRQAFSALGVDRPKHLLRTYSCDQLAARAKTAGKFIAATDGRIAPGCLFLVRGAKPNDWVHTGLVIAVDAKTITTIEGNTNDEGSREGYEVCQRIRNRANLDAVLL